MPAVAAPSVETVVRLQATQVFFANLFETVLTPLAREIGEDELDERFPASNCEKDPDFFRAEARWDELAAQMMADVAGELLRQAQRIRESAAHTRQLAEKLEARDQEARRKEFELDG